MCLCAVAIKQRRPVTYLQTRPVHEVQRRGIKQQKQLAAVDLLCYPAVHILGHITGHEVD